MITSPVASSVRTLTSAPLRVLPAVAVGTFVLWRALTLQSPLVVALLLVGIAVVLAGIATSAYLSSEGLLSFRGLFAAFFFLTFVLRPLQILETGETQWVKDFGAVTPLLGRALALVFVGVLSYAAGYVSKLHGPIAARIPIPRTLTAANVSWTRLLIAGVIGLVGLAVLVGDPTVWLTNLFYRRELLAGRFYQYALAQLFALACVLGASVLLPLRGRRLAAWTLIIAGALSLAVLGGRSAVVSILLIGAVLHDRHARRLGPGALMLLVATLSLFIVGYLQFRLGSRDDNAAAVDWESIYTGNLLESTIASGFTGVDRLMVLVDGVPSEIPLQYGSTYLRVVTSVVPRAWWPQKPGLSEASVYAPLFGTSTGMYPASFVGDLFLNGHIVAVLFGMWAMGLLHASFDRWRNLNSMRPTVTVFYAVMMSTLSGGIGNVGIVNMVLMNLPIAALLFYVRARTHTATWLSSATMPIGVAARRPS